MSNMFIFVIYAPSVNLKFQSNSLQLAQSQIQNKQERFLFIIEDTFFLHKLEKYLAAVFHIYQTANVFCIAHPCSFLAFCVLIHGSDFK